jgi:acyl-CoA thioester hydrolase
MLLMSAPPDGYRFHTLIHIRYGDMDTLGHVNNAKYLTYLEHARILYFHELKLWDGSLSEQGLIVARTTVDYKLPLAVEDVRVDVWTRIGRLGTRSFDMEYLMIRTRDGREETAATGLIVVVVYNYVANTTAPIPDDWRERITAYEPALAK